MTSTRLIIAVLFWALAAGCAPNLQIPTGISLVVGYTKDYESSSVSNASPVEVFDGANRERFAAMPVPAEGGQAPFFIRGGFLRTPSGGAVELPRGCGTAIAGIGTAISRSRRTFLCIGDDQTTGDQGPLYALNVLTGSVRVFRQVAMLRDAFHELSIREDGNAFGLVVDRKCPAVGPEGYATRGIELNLISGSVTKLACTGSVVLNARELIPTRRVRRDWQFFDSKRGTWIDGEAEAAIGDAVYYQVAGCLFESLGTRCLVRGVWFAYTI